MKLQKISDIKVGEKYTVVVSNIFRENKKEPEFFNFKELVLAKTSKEIIAILLGEVKVPKKDRESLLKLKYKDFIENESAVTQKYEEFIVILDIKKKEVYTYDGTLAVFLK